ncbi:IgE-binding protein [Talaromyces stipitatus ATCC 10500]|uniref:IgE-binding protein n=1 Tax=Talaromyces stipitatus (strain ATCC 10500 / CBS 375.48 / QM 6759 / NRRL 1006) TaxID=441959 RepID=B8M4L7_TALSN|nr:IgE-binding protein [Talaromyces stipitatus ATCC 10500]EED19212.1 IgE-binding protein [Talaromyces stipitatus ATCC 10500]
MKFSVIAPAVLAACAAALPTAQEAKPDAAGPFSLMALRSASPLHFQPINAAGQKFWVGGSTSSYCPSNIDPCPPGTQTVFANTNGLDVEVPGGQAVYVDPSGALSFTQAHSAYIPEGSVQGPFTYTPGQPFGTYTTGAFGSTGFMACPDNAAAPTKWQVFAAIQNATVPTGNVGDCLGFDAAAIEYSGEIPAWHIYYTTMLTKDIPIDNHHIQTLEERLLDLDRKILKHHDRLLEKTERLVSSTTHICNELQTTIRTLNNQASVINNTKHIVSAQARTISAQARKIRAQQGMIDVLQRDIFRLGRWYTESLGRINMLDETITDRGDDIRELWQALNRHTAFVERVERDKYWMHVYTKQVMMLRAAELEFAVTADDDRDEDDDEGSVTAESICMDSTIVTPLQPHILLDKIVVHMMKDVLPDRFGKVCDGFEIVHGSSATVHGRDDVEDSENGSDEMLRGSSDED